jgi:RimJ/RimL family protein N-acetyltransferase
MSHVIGKGWRFPFMRANDIEIGPCWTAYEYRRQGIYSTVIQRILFDFKNHHAWMFTQETNIASIRGIEKVGFKFSGKGRRTKPLGFHFLGRFCFWQ